MPLVASSGAMSARVFGLSSAGGASYWIATLGGANTDVGNGIAIDSSGNIHVVGATDSAGAGGNDILVTKYNTIGTIEWQVVLGSATADQGYGIALDSGGNVYVTGVQDGGARVTVAKYSISGTLLWQRRLSGTGNNEGRGVAVSAAGDVFVVGSENGFTNLFITKYDTSGTLAWARNLNNTGGLDQGYGVSVDGSGNAYLVAQTTINALILKYDPSGASGSIGWQNTLSAGGFGTVASFRAIDVDPSGNAFVSGDTSSGGGGLLVAALLVFRWLF